VREAATTGLRQAIQAHEFVPNTNTELLIDAIIGAIYYRLLLKSGPLTGEYGDQLID